MYIFVRNTKNRLYLQVKPIIKPVFHLFILSLKNILKKAIMNDSIAQLGTWISKHKYLFVTISFLIIIVFLDENNMMKHIQNKREIATLEAEKAVLQEEYDNLTNKLDELNADPELIEKIARERYGMHKANEEVFIFDD